MSHPHLVTSGAMPLGSRQQHHRARGQSGSELAIEVSADELPSQVAEDHVQVDEMEYEEQGAEEEEEDEEELEGEFAIVTPSVALETLWSMTDIKNRD